MYGYEFYVQPESTASAKFERVLVFAKTLAEAEDQLAAVTFNGQPLASWKLRDSRYLTDAKN
jgi:hypothetical protein